ncbi:MAG: hypothetical protein ACI9WV_002450 [Patiriisocius sp.]|jgi:hypothetical protein
MKHKKHSGEKNVQKATLALKLFAIVPNRNG